MTRALLAATVLAAVALLPATAEGAERRPVIVGIGDQKPAMFFDPRFGELGIRHARLVVPWDVLNQRWQRAELWQWLRHARRVRVQPLIAFTHSRLPGRRRVLPSVDHWSRKFAAFREKYPWIRDYATWNEANHCGEPTCRRTKRVAGYWLAMRRRCPQCRILGAELLDFPNMARWVRSFQRHAGEDPEYWGLHNYRDANRMQVLNTRRLLRTTRGKVWLTETGGIVRRLNRSTVGFKESPQHAARATRWVFDKLVKLSPRVERVYLYHWNASTTEDTWDSGLVGPLPELAERPALRVLRRVLREGRRLRELAG
jgi:hypothetical protein